VTVLVLGVRLTLNYGTLVLPMKQIPTGIKGLDELLGGGFPKGKCLLVVGSPGSGKTTFGMQFLYNGALSDERGLYISLDEKPERVKENLSPFGWDLDKLEREGKLLFIDGTPIRKVKRSISGPYARELLETSVLLSIPELTLKSLVTVVSRVVQEEGIQRVVVDPITALALRYIDPSKKRRATLFFFDSLIDTGCTSLVTTELRTGILNRSFQVEEFLSQGVVLLHTIVHEGNVIRALQIEKMRGIQHDTQLRPYQISKNGIEVFPKDRVF